MSEQRIVCPHCEANNMPGQVVCFRCGRPVVATVAPDAGRGIAQTYFGCIAVLFAGLFILFAATWGLTNTLLAFGAIYLVGYGCYRLGGLMFPKR